ncbi:MAG: LacI family DNA-binding transcriptional regulator [Saprospiraceae bacterium]|nr:LacI family DNA-binding transcriptional regulator [Saprospiraceae bacterium]
MGRITIKDIARALDIHPSTVSRALKDHPDVGQQTKAAVQQLAKELGYSPNQQAIQFRHRKSGLIGLILPSINMFFFPSVIQAAEEEASRNGYKLLVFQSNKLLTKEQQIIQLCQDFRLEGVLIALSNGTTNMDHVEQLRAQDVPVVLFDKVFLGGDWPLVRIGDARAAEMAVRHLYKQGYQNIIGLFDNAFLHISQQRYHGFSQALTKEGMQPREDWVFFVDNAEEAEELVLNALAQNPEIDGIFVMSDELLAEVMRILDKTGKQVPSELGIVAISDGRLPYITRPKVTYIHHSGFEVGRQAAGMLFQLIRDVPLFKREVEVPVYLVMQESTTGKRGSSH